MQYDTNYWVQHLIIHSSACAILGLPLHSTSCGTYRILRNFSGMFSYFAAVRLAPLRSAGHLLSRHITRTVTSSHVPCRIPSRPSKADGGMSRRPPRHTLRVTSHPVTYPVTMVITRTITAVMARHDHRAAISGSEATHPASAERATST